MSSFSSQLHLLEQQPQNKSKVRIILRIRKPTQSELHNYRKNKIVQKQSARNYSQITARSLTLFKSGSGAQRGRQASTSRGRSISPCSSRSPFSNKVKFDQSLGTKNSRALIKTPKAAKNNSLLQSTTALLNTQPNYCPDFPYSIFTTTNSNNNNEYVIASEHPVCDKIILESQSNRLLTFCENNIIAPDSFLYKYDNVFSQIHNQQKVYNKTCRSLVHALLLGKTSTIFLFGPHQSGKTHTIKGGQAAERGILSRSVEEIFHFFTLNRHYGQNSSQSMKDHYPPSLQYYDIADVGNKSRIKSSNPASSSSSSSTSVYKYTLRFAMIAISKDRVIDLNYSAVQNAMSSHSTALDSEAVISQDGETFRERRFVKIKNMDEFIKYQRMHRKQWGKYKSSHPKWFKSPSHFIYTLRVDRMKRKKLGSSSASSSAVHTSTIDVVQLVSSEEALNDSNIAQAFNSISNDLVKAAAASLQKQSNQNHYVSANRSTVLKFLSLPLVQQYRIQMIATVAPGFQQHFKHSLAALKFCSQIRYHILKNQLKHDTALKMAIDPIKQIKQEGFNEENYKSSSDYEGQGFATQTQSFLQENDEPKSSSIKVLLHSSPTSSEDAYNADMQWVNQRRNILDRMLQIADNQVKLNQNFPKQVVQDIILVQTQLQMKAKEYYKQLAQNRQSNTIVTSKRTNKPVDEKNMRGNKISNPTKKSVSKKVAGTNTRKSTGSPLRNCLEKIPKLDLQTHFDGTARNKDTPQFSGLRSPQQQYYRLEAASNRNFKETVFQQTNDQQQRIKQVKQSEPNEIKQKNRYATQSINYTSPSGQFQKKLDFYMFSPSRDQNNRISQNQSQMHFLNQNKQSHSTRATSSNKIMIQQQFQSQDREQSERKFDNSSKR